MPSLDDLLPDSDHRGRRFVIAFLGLLALALLIHGGFNALVDPYEFYDSPLERERPLTVRRLKLELLERAMPPPEGLILGSSRVRALDPRLAGERFGVRFFHAGGPVGGAADWLSFSRYATSELGHPIQLLLLGVDTPSFTSQPSLWLHPVSYPELRRQLRYPALIRARSLIHLWSPHQTRLSWRLLTARTDEEVRRARVRFAGDWRLDGFRPRNPSLDAEQIFQGNLEAHHSHWGVEPSHHADFEALVDFAAERGITVVSFITPEAPRLRRALEQTSYPEARARTEEILRGARDRGVLFCDLDLLPLAANDFVDPHHLSRGGGAKVLRMLQVCAERRGWGPEAG
ncbi:MAG: hypothetical protein GY719_32605 [bacterium]|nr:hypothetical protein [bacterium]